MKAVKTVDFHRNIYEVSLKNFDSSGLLVQHKVERSSLDYCPNNDKQLPKIGIESIPEMSGVSNTPQSKSNTQHNVGIDFGLKYVHSN